MSKENVTGGNTNLESDSKLKVSGNEDRQGTSTIPNLESESKSKAAGNEYRRERETLVNCLLVGIATILSYILVAITLPFSLFLCFMVTEEYQRAVIFRMGRVRVKALGPGLIFILRCVDEYEIVDLRSDAYEVPTQEILTRDFVTVSVDAVVYYSIVDPIKSITMVEHYSASTELLAATTLRNVLGTRDLGQLLSDREAISRTMQTTLDEATEPWGVEVSSIEIKDIRLPEELQKAMAAEAEASREARAKVIAAKGEIKAATALQEASIIMIENPIALQLRYLQSLNYVSAGKDTTIIFPFPMEFLKSFLGRRGT